MLPLNRAFTLVRKWAFAMLILFALNAFSLNLGYGSPIFSRLCGFMSLIGAIFLNGHIYAKIFNKNIFISGFVLIFLSLIILFSLSQPVFWLASLPIFICGYDLILRSTNHPKDQLPPLALGSLIYTAFYIFYIHIPALWLGVRSFSQVLSSILGRIVWVTLDVGPTMSGTLIFLTFVSFSLGFFILSKKETAKSWKIFLSSLAGLTLVYAGYVLILTSTWMTIDMSMNNIYLVFLILIIPFTLYVPRFELKSIDVGVAMPAPKCAVALLATLILIVLISSNINFNVDRVGKAVIYEKDTEMGFDIPHFPKLNESFEPDMGFSVGAIKLYLENIGYSVDELNDTNSLTLNDSLRDADILVMMNLKKPFAPDDLEAIWDFVRRGGGLLIFGDHTSMFVEDQDFLFGRDYLSEVLAPTGIKINPDTADYIGGHWKYGVAPLPHYVTRNLGFEISTSSVGASLELSGRAKPVIIGRYSFSDRSDIAAPGHLGNRLYEKGEALGDMVVAASDTYGKGKILVFGDTSYIFNVELPFRYKLLYDSIAWLRSDELENASASIIVLIAVILFIVIRKPHIKITSLSLVRVALIVAFSLAVSASISGSLIQTPHSAQKDLAWIDHTHLNKFSTEDYQADGITGLTTNLFRNGYLPMVMEKKGDFSDVLKGKIFVIIAPNEFYTPKETLILKEFVEGGGLLILSAGHMNSDPLDSILKSFDMQIGDLPLGSPPWIVETHGTGGQGTVTQENLEKYWHRPKFMEAYSVLASGEYRPVTWVNYRGSNYNLIISKKYGQGDVILIGDSRFLLNENLEDLSMGPGMETKEQYQLQWLGNIELLREMLAGSQGDEA
jgi:hypothetical protein